MPEVQRLGLKLSIQYQLEDTIAAIKGYKPQNGNSNGCHYMVCTLKCSAPEESSTTENDICQYLNNLGICEQSIDCTCTA